MCKWSAVEFVPSCCAEHRITFAAISKSFQTILTESDWTLTFSKYSSKELFLSSRDSVEIFGFLEARSTALDNFLESFVSLLKMVDEADLKVEAAPRT